MNTATRRRAALTAALLVAAFGLGACGDDDDTSTAADDTTTTVPADETPADDAPDDAPEGETVVITAVDYGFEGLPDSVPVGTKLSLANEGHEPHELVAMRIPDDETRPVEELMKLPQEELQSILGPDAAPAMVLLAAHGKTDMPGAVMGDGTLSEPGRYAIVCFLPVGSDDSILESEGPPEGDAPPHITQGMFGELTVA